MSVLFWSHLKVRVKHIVTVKELITLGTLIHRERERERERASWFLVKKNSFHHERKAVRASPSVGDSDPFSGWWFTLLNVVTSDEAASII